MKLYCKYYRCALHVQTALAQLMDDPKIQPNAFAVEGAVVIDNKRVTCVGKTVSIIVSYEAKEMLDESSLVTSRYFFLLTCNEKFANSTDSLIDASILETAGIGLRLSYLLEDKFSKSGNEFSITFKLENKRKLTVAGVEGQQVEYRIQEASREMITTDLEQVASVLEGTSGISRLTYTSTGAGLKRSVEVEGSFNMIMREVAHYLNRTIVLVELSRNSEDFKEYAIDSNGALEIVTRADGSRFFNNVPVARMHELNPLGIYTTSKDVRALRREIAETGSPKAVGGLI